MILSAIFLQSFLEAKKERREYKLDLKNQQKKLQQIRQLVTQFLPEYRYISTSDIEVTKLSGLTNETFKISKKNNKKQVKNYVLRIFGNTEGLLSPEKESKIFKELSDTGIGPKNMAEKKGVWRIEEFIEGGIHPSLQELQKTTTRLLMAIYIARFHKNNIKLDENALTDELLNDKTDLFQNFKEKIQKQDLFDKKELIQIETLKQLIGDEWINYLKQIKPKEQRFNITCHNDLNNNNIFYMPKGHIGHRVKLIDFEYVSRNYVGYDLANFMNESCIDYSLAEYPFFTYLEDKEYSQKEIELFATVYLVSYYDLPASSLLEKLIVINDNQQNEQQIETEVRSFIVKFLDQMADKKREQFEEDLVILRRQINAGRIICNWYWACWCILTCKPEFPMDFGHLEHGICRLDLMKKFSKIYDDLYMKN